MSFTAHDITDMYGDDPGNIDKLNPMLSLWVFEDQGFGKILKHPFVFQVPFFSWKLANQSFELKLQKIMEAEKEKNWAAYLNWFERPWRMTKLMELWREKKITQEELREHLAWVWQDTEFPRQFVQSKVVKLFRSAGFINDSDESNFNPITQPTVIYRGINNPDKKWHKGLSWTQSPQTAEFFAKRFSKGNGVVLKTIIEPEACLAVMDGRGESELIVDPKMIGDVFIVDKGVGKR